MKRKALLTFYLTLIITATSAQTIDTCKYFPMIKTWDTSPYKSFKLKGGVNTNYDMTFRLLWPKNYDSSATNLQTYPLILMLHGAGESALGNDRFGKYDVGDPRRFNNDNQLKHHGLEYLNAVNSGTWPGFVLFPQNNYGGWDGANWLLADVVEIIETLSKTLKINPNRIYITGLSSGAIGVWTGIARYPHIFAAAVGFSGIQPASENNTTKVAHLPLWYFQGGKDPNPSKSLADSTITALRKAGGTPRYTVYPGAEHNTWQAGITEPDFFPFLLRHTKLHIHPYFGKTNFELGETVNVRLGISPGFSAYEWRKDDALIEGAISNEILATSEGSYTVRFRRGESSWTEWSAPLVITAKTVPSITAHPVDQNKALGQKATFSVTATGTAPLAYQWQKDNLNIAGATSSTYTINNSALSHVGSYKVIVKNPYGKVTSNVANLSVDTGFVVSIESPLAGAYYREGEVINYAGKGTDSKGVTIAKTFSWELKFHRPKGDSIVWTKTGGSTGNFTIPETSDTTLNALYKLSLTVTDSQGRKGTATTNLRPHTSKILLATQPSGLQVYLDSRAVLTPYNFEAVEGTKRFLGVISPQTLAGKKYKFAYWLHDEKPVQNITIPQNDFSYTAVFVEDIPPSTETPLDDVDDLSFNETLKLYPNPSSGDVFLEFESSSMEKVGLEVINYLGQRVGMREVTAQIGLNSFKVDGAQFRRGVYVLILTKNKKVYRRKLIIEK